MIDQAIATLPKKKDGDWTGGKTCRSLIYDAIGDAAYASIRGAPWAVEVEVALHNLCLAVDRAIDADPVLKQIFDRPRPETPHESVPFHEWQGGAECMKPRMLTDCEVDIYARLISDPVFDQETREAITLLIRRLGLYDYKRVRERVLKIDLALRPELPGDMGERRREFDLKYPGLAMIDDGVPF
jgi:hypothetical protein